jgi:transposase
MNNNKKIELLQKVTTFVGIDIAKKTHFATLIDKQGKEISVGMRISNDKQGFDDLEAQLKAWNKNEIMIGVEPTGHYWKSLGHYLKDRGYLVTLVNPYHVKLTKELRDNSRSKNDIKDSKVIGHLLGEGKFLETKLPMNINAELRNITNLRMQLTEDHSRIKIRIKALFDEYLPEYEGCFSDMTCLTSLSLLKKYTLKELKNDQLHDQKVELITVKSRKIISQQKAEKIVGRLSKSIGVSEGIESAQFQLSCLLDQLQLYQTQLQEVESKINKILEFNDEAKSLLKIKGLGPLLVGSLLGQIGSFHDFDHYKQIVKFAGLNPVENSSGAHKSKITASKRGRSTLRNILHQIALSLVLNDPEFKKLYEYKVNTLKKPKMVALTVVAIKFLRIIFHVIKNKKEYDNKFVLEGLSIS